MYNKDGINQHHHRFIVPFSYRVGLHHSISSARVLMKRIGAEFLRPDNLPGVNHMHGMQCQIVLNLTFRLKNKMIQ